MDRDFEGLSRSDDSDVSQLWLIVRFPEPSISIERAPQESDVASSQSSKEDRTATTNRDSRSWPTIVSD